MRYSDSECDFGWKLLRKSIDHFLTQLCHFWPKLALFRRSIKNHPSIYMRGVKKKRKKLMILKIKIQLKIINN